MNTEVSTIESTVLVWRDISISVTFHKFRFGGPMHHIELRASERLPVTETGYKSHFFVAEENMTLQDTVDLITDWLDTTAASIEWRDYVEASRQGDFFDLKT